MQRDYMEGRDSMDTAAIWDTLKEARHGDHLWQRWLAVVQKTLEATGYNIKFLEINTSTEVRLNHGGCLNVFYTVRDWGHLFGGKPQFRGTGSTKIGVEIERVVESLNTNADLIAIKATNLPAGYRPHGENLVFLWHYPEYHDPEWELIVPLLHGQTVHLIVKDREIKMRVQIGDIELTQNPSLEPSMLGNANYAFEKALRTTYDICGMLDYGDVMACLLQNGWVNLGTSVFRQGVIKA